ncbi:MAG: hypothetical protein KDA93_20185 [Planctomycetaceae bacterium]|nr:hypothetical protein [Planctomycetaceae bacterium]
MTNIRQPRLESVNGLLDKLTQVNRLAHHARHDADRRRFFKNKNELISFAITKLEECCRYSYQAFDDGRVMVVVAISGAKTRTFHQPFEKLSVSAQTRVYNAIGTPAASRAAVA